MKFGTTENTVDPVFSAFRHAQTLKSPWARPLGHRLFYGQGTCIFFFESKHGQLSASLFTVDSLLNEIGVGLFKSCQCSFHLVPCRASLCPSGQRAMFSGVSREVRLRLLL